MSNIINIKDFKEKTVKRLNENKSKELELICDDVIAIWTVNFHSDMIDEMLCDRINVQFHEYTNDLNALSEIEQSFGVNFVIFGPGTTENSEAGYIVGIKLPDEQIIATPEMMTENLARIFAILFYNELMVQDYFND